MTLKSTVGIMIVVSVLALASGAFSVTVPVSIYATSEELGGQQPDVFHLGFECTSDIRLTQATYDLTTTAGQAGGHLFFNTVPEGAGAWDFHMLPDTFFPALVSSATVGSHISSDGSPLLTVNFTHFAPGEVLLFDIDVDGPDCTTWTGAQFVGAQLTLVFDLGPAFPGQPPATLNLQFGGGADMGVLDARRELEVPGVAEVPEPAPMLLVGTALVGLFGYFRRRRMK